MHIKTNQSADAANILLSQTAATKTAAQSNPGALSFTTAPSSTNDLQPTPEELLASTDNLDDATAADQATTSASKAILSQSSLAFSAQGNLNPDTVFQLLAD
jgi:hypothetical protein